ncbi:MAG: CrcB family protein [Candidatus Babeliales bacterium]|jgi:CrcB protein
MQALYVWMIVCGGIGSLLRYMITQGITSWYGTSTMGTLLVNVVGCFLFGFFYAWFVRGGLTPYARALVLSGFLGGFTTMSAFAGDVFVAFNQQRFFDGSVYFIATNVGAVMAVWVGFATFNTILK